MIPVTEMRAGRLFEENGEPYQVLDYKHTKMGRGTASIKLKVKNLTTGAVTEKTFISGAKVEPVETMMKTVQYLYKEGNDYFFMDPQSFEQFSLSQKLLAGKEKFLKEEQTVKILFWEQRPLMVELPITMVFTIVQTSPGVKGDSVNASFKPATLDNGLKVKVPLFINVGDRIKVDTRSGEYLERAT
ncbi:elongation factor P [Candidatus Woesebacteria bacterium CG_4_10_14_0_2_um_filter_39_14]|uniref:Elongation factor P n=2 Tax=Microgenomates group TaxID=1794810 RepID=A0A2M6YPE7_9BACT|nr:MAG: elongation factor P [Candidatus Shapirobacteria bacterium CG07_land_8_20_14_0_80_39_12]PIZ49674.1 MAG: elongation factor P [Candidatus Woesebacteria bacterium CG_4_10_14_0_2_um_filter_39_14]